MADDNNLEIGVKVDATQAEAGSNKAKTAVGAIGQTAAGLEQAFRRLKSSIDPTFQAQERYNRSLMDNRALFREGMIGAEEFRQGMAAARAELQNSLTALEQNSVAFREAAAAKKLAAAEAATAAKAQAAAERLAAREAAQEIKLQAREAAAAKKAADREARESARQAAAEIKAAAREAAQAEKTASREAAEAAKQAAREKRAAARQAAADIKSASRESAQAERDAARAAREMANEQTRAAREAKMLANAERELRASIDPAYAAQMRYNDTMRQAASLLMQNKLRTGEFTAIQKQAAQQMEINTRTLGRQNTGYVQLGYQAQDVTASLASGINPLVILAQQGGQTAAAMSQMGGKFAGVASFMAGPWGAAILGGILVLGMLIPKLYDTESASDAAAAGQKRFGDMLDNTTGRIKNQIGWLERLAAANDEARIAEKQRAEGAESNRKLMFRVTEALAPKTVNAGYGQSIDMPAEIQGRSAQWIKAWTASVKAGRMETTELALRISRLGNLDPTVKGLANRVVELGGGIEKINREAETSEARRASLLGKTLTTRQKQLLEIKDTTEKTSEAELKANVTLATTTDAVEKARARLTLAEAEATRTRAKLLAEGEDQAVADKAYMDGITKETAAVQAAEAAKTAASKAASAARKQERADAAAAKREREEQLRFDLEDLDYRKELARDDFEEQMRLQDQKLERLKGFYGEDSRNYVMALREKERMTRQHNQTLLNLERERIQLQASIAEANANTDNSVAVTGAGMGSDQLNTMGRLGMLNGRQIIEAKRAELQQLYGMQLDHENNIYQIRLKSIRDQLALANLEPQQKIQINGQLEQLEAEHQNKQREMAASYLRDVNKVNLEVIEKQSEKWRNATGSISQSMQQMFQGIWMHSGSFRDNMLNIADQLVFKYVNAGFEIAADWAANELAKTAASLMGNTVRTQAAVAGAATQKTVSAAAGMAEITNQAGQAAAGAYKSTVVIPFIGPVAAPAAAALALAAVMGFSSLISARGGQGEVGEDGQLSLLHKKEMVLPAWIAEPLRNTLKSPRSMAPIMSGAMMGGATAREAMSQSQSLSFKYSPTIHGAGKDDFETTLRKNARQMRKWAKNQQRNGAFRMDQNR